MKRHPRHVIPFQKPFQRNNQRQPDMASWEIHLDFSCPDTDSMTRVNFWSGKRCSGQSERTFTRENGMIHFSNTHRKADMLDMILLLLLGVSLTQVVGCWRALHRMPSVAIRLRRLVLSNMHPSNSIRCIPKRRPALGTACDAPWKKTTRHADKTAMNPAASFAG